MAPTPEVRHYSRNQSARGAGSAISLIVLHDTEGANLPGILDLIGLGNFFDVAAVQASCHAANDAAGNDARYVPDSRKAWHCAGYNSVSVGLEQIGFASQKAWPEAQLKNSAEWIVYWSKLYDIPIRRGRVKNGRVVTKGVVMHSELGTIGGGHHDPGPAYPIDHVLALARDRAVASEFQPDARKQKVWKQHLSENRARLKSLLALRGRLRQRKLEKSAQYAQTTTQLSSLRAAITRLKRLIGG